MKKVVISFAVSAFLLAGGTMTAFANNSGGNSGGNNSSPDSPSHMGEYWVKNKAIQVAWAALPNSTKNYYINHPNQAPKLLFPFGIDVENHAPIGYPTCIEGLLPASYEPTTNLPSICNANDDHGHPEH